MTRLEQLGLEVAAAVWMEIPLTEGRLLACLVMRPGQTVDFATLDRLMKSPVRTRGCHRLETPEHGRLRVRAYIHRIRTALDDLGFAGVIEPRPGEGYAIEAKCCPSLRQAIEAAA